MSWLDLFNFCGGLGLFLYGMEIMASGLQKAAGNKLKNILSVLTKNRLLGVILGTAVTAIIQSSSATTVMVVGFVNASLMNLQQAVGVIMGANIGTTVTAWLVSSAEWAKFLKPETLAPMAIFIGAVMVIFCKKSKAGQIGEIIAGFGMLFLGITLMSSGVDPLKDSPMFVKAFSSFGSNPLLGILAGAVVTGIIQSSSASVGILQTLAVTGIVQWDAAIYIIMGQNIGTCVTAMLSALGASRTAKGAAYIHLMFNIIGSVAFSIVAVIFFMMYPEVGKQPISMVGISTVHTVFNIANTILLFPFAKPLVKIAEIMSRSSIDNEDESTPIHLDDRILSTPSIAIESCVKEIVRLGNNSLKNLELACQVMLNKGSDEDINKILEREEKIDNLTKGITQFMVKLTNSNITTPENNYVTSLFHAVHDLERIGDHCENMAEFTQNMIDENLEFSPSAKVELEEMFRETQKCVRNAITALENNNIDLAEKVIKEEERVDNLEKSLRQKHIERLVNNECNPLVGVVFLDVLTNMERVSDHALNLAQIVIEDKVS